MNPKMMIAIGQNLRLSNSIDKVQQSQSSRSKSVRVNSTVATSTTIPHPEKFTSNKIERLKSGRTSGKKLRGRNAECITKNDDGKVRKLRNDECSSDYAIDNYSIDKTARSSLTTKNSKSNYQNLTTEKLQPSIYIPVSEVLSVPSSHNNEYNYEVCF